MALDDPHGFANLNRLVQWRRAMPTINFPLGSATVLWDGATNVGDNQHAGLVLQATRNITGAQQGPVPSDAVLDDIVRFETSLFSAQLGGSCSGCHNSANNGTNVEHKFFDVRTASADVRTEDLPLYTFRNRATGELRQLTDGGRGQIAGRWQDLSQFKTPTLRALAARAPYFHNRIAPTLESVVRHYEAHLGFVFTDEERAALVAFLSAL